MNDRPSVAGSVTTNPQAIAELRERLLQGLARADADAGCLHQAACAVLQTAPVDDKLRELQSVLQRVCSGELRCAAELDTAAGPDQPGRPVRPELVAPRQLKQRGLGTPAGRAALLHAVAHIEFNAINLALDAVQRFSGLPLAYYADWLSVADDEARHFSLLRGRLAELGHDYGDFPAHDGLWQMARESAGSVLERMALVPRLLEARGLDVTPAMMQRLRHAADAASADCLAVILAEEERHVAIGSHWHAEFCGQAGIDPQAHFLALLAERAPAVLRRPFNTDARLRAGFSRAELMALEQLTAEPAPPTRREA